MPKKLGLTYSRREWKNTDWFEANIAEMEPLIEKEGAALTNHKCDPSQTKLQAMGAGAVRLSEMHVAVQTNTGCSCARPFRVPQTLDPADVGHQTSQRCANQEVGSTEDHDSIVIADHEKQIARWVEHYLKLCSRETLVSQGAIEDLPVLAKLDAEPTVEELSRAIDALKRGKGQHSYSLSTSFSVNA